MKEEEEKQRHDAEYICTQKVGARVQRLQWHVKISIEQQ